MERFGNAPSLLLTITVTVACCFMSVSSNFAEERVPEICGLPEVVDAGSTGSINFTGRHLIQSYDECYGDYTDRYRTADGTCNNVFNYGSARRPPRRLLPNAYDDHLNAPRILDTQGFPLPAATNISRTVHTRKDVNQRFTVMLMQWGQFIDHDMTGFPISSEVDRSIRCCGENGEILPYRPDRECFPIELTPEDSNVRFINNCMEFARSVAARDRHGKKMVPREQVNSVTSFIDGSMVYGSSLELQEELREYTKSGPSYLLRTVDVNNCELLPESPEQNCVREPGEHCFLAGDERVNEQPGLAVLHTVFVRLHNAIACRLKPLRPADSDEELFQETRKIVSAIIQNIHYSEWLPIIIGRKNMRKFSLVTGTSTDYIPSVDPRITNAFSTAAFRFGHSLIPKGFKIGYRFVPLRNLFNRPHELFRNFQDVLLALVKPIRSNGAQTFDRFFTEEITGHLFEPEPSTPSRGLDLVALNIQRGRDHGIPPYNKYREFCGLPTLRKFSDLPSDIAKLFGSVYRSVDDIDLFSGLMAEPPESRQLVGRTLACLLGNQFHALKYGDRFYFETTRQPEGFTPDQLKAIRKVTMAHVLCETETMKEIQKRAFEIVTNSSYNRMVPCASLRDNKFLNMNLWRQTY